MKYKKTRPHVWKIQGEIPHSQHIAWQRMKAQAAYRQEPWNLSFEDFQRLWDGYWHLRGRIQGSYCLTRLNHGLAWDARNTVCISRAEAIAISNRKERRYETA